MAGQGALGSNFVVLQIPLVPRTFVKWPGFLSNVVFFENSRFPAYFVKWGWSSRLPVKAFCGKSQRFFVKFLCFLISAIGRSGRCFVKLCVFCDMSAFAACFVKWGVFCQILWFLEIHVVP